MMRKLFFYGTALFWIGVLAAWTAGSRAPDNSARPAAGADRPIGLAEIARHATAGDCWMALDGIVYDITAYLPDHPSNPRIILPWCGKEASEAYRTKTRGRPHSAEADGLLRTYRIGVLGNASR